MQNQARCIDAVGTEANVTASVDSVIGSGQGRHLHGHASAPCAPPGDPLLPQFRHRLDRRRLRRSARQHPMGSAINRGLTFRMAQTPVQKYLPSLLERVEKGEIDPSFVITHHAPLDQGPELYRTFRDKKDGCVKVVLKS